MNLPRHQRSRPAFADMFERDDAETIAAMDGGGYDIPNQAPQTPLALQRVGVNRRAIPVQIVDPFGGSQPAQLSCAVEAHVSVADDRRGIHVSRIGHLLAEMSDKVYPSLQDYAARFAELLLETQESRGAGVSVDGVLTYLEQVSGVKEKASLEHLDLFAKADFVDGRISVASGIGFTHITACPCVQETYRHSFASAAVASGRARRADEMPLLTHTQRCRTRILFSHGATAPPGLGELLRCLDGVVVRSLNTLPREFELLNVYRAHAGPQFLEDALRDLLFAVYQLRRGADPREAIEIKSVSMESIHDFDMEGEIKFSLKELERIFHSQSSIKLVSNGAHSNGDRRIVRVQKAGRKKPGKPFPMNKSPQAHSRRS
ncbi:MAG: GTP cyclohydrolase, FolE2/MptA family [Chthoniobacterales bacterium]